jgi:GT2 family glycosyltransferase
MREPMAGLVNNLSDTRPPIFSVIILGWNSERHLATCLHALQAQNYRDFEVVLIDNGSSKPITIEDLKKYSDLPITLHRLEKNIGFAAGNNLAVDFTRGPYLAFLNSDAFPKPDWLESISEATMKHPACFFASKQVQADDEHRLDGTGDVYHVSGLAWRRSFNVPAARASMPEGPVFSACAAAAVYPRNAFVETGGFDADYFAYHEDVDLGFRLRLLGFTCIYLPQAVVAHVGSASTGRRSDLSVYYGQRNLVWTFFKDMPTLMLVLLTPWHLLANALMVIMGIFRRQGQITWKAKQDAFKQLPTILKKRKLIQRTRKVSTFKLMQSLDWDPISPLLKLAHK